MVLLMFLNYLLITPTPQIHLQFPQSGDLITKKPRLHRIEVGAEILKLFVIQLRAIARIVFLPWRELDGFGCRRFR